MRESLTLLLFYIGPILAITFTPKLLDWALGPLQKEEQAEAPTVVVQRSADAVDATLEQRQAPRDNDTFVSEGPLTEVSMEPAVNEPIMVTMASDDNQVETFNYDEFRDVNTRAA